ncbi:MAG: VOC family protein [Paracoccaceae bacterium]
MDSSRQPVSFIATDQPDETQAFFSDVLGLELVERSPFALVYSDAGHVLRIQIVPIFQPASYTVHGWQVENIVDGVAGLMAKDVRFQFFDHLPQDQHGIWTTPDGHKIAWFTDPCGNILSLTQYAES